MRRLLPYALILTIGLAACSVDVKYSQYKPVSNKGWSIEDTMRFTPDTLRQDGCYSFTCGVRTRRSFPYRDLVMIVERNVWRDSVLMIQKLERVTCPIVNDAGNQTGDGVALKQHETRLEDFDLETGDSIVVKIYHQMTRKTLPGIVDIGITMKNEN